MCRNSPHSSTFASLSDVPSTPSLIPLACDFGCGARLMSCKMRGRRVTIPVPRGRLSRISFCRACLGWCAHTNLCQQCFPTPNSYHWTVTLRQRFEEDRWGFEPGLLRLGRVVRIVGMRASDDTYADCREDILELVDKCNQPRVVDIDATGHCQWSLLSALCCGLGTHELGGVAMVGKPQT